MPNHIQITFTDLQPEQQELLIAHLTEAGYEGFEEGDFELKAYIPQSGFDKLLLHEIAYKYQLGFTEKVIPEKNWNAEWESHFQPVIIDDFVVIRADFHPSSAGVKHEIIITPKMSFGTGHHASTLMMIRQMKEIDFTGKKVCDFGTGTGILAILAEKLDAAGIIAVDSDDWSIANAKENMEKNHCKKIKLLQQDSIPGEQSFDIILANINKNVILENFSAFAGHLCPGGTLVVSGLLSSDDAEILKNASFFSFKLVSKKENNNWICLRFSH